jgi:nucleoside-diphosphate-sugar epimerase
MQLFCFGAGYTAAFVAHRLRPREWRIAGTKTRLNDDAATDSGAMTLAEFRGDAPSERVRELLDGTTHVLVSVPPDVQGDPVLRHHGADLAALGSLCWVGYLSTVGVYGDWRGAWVDEDSPVRPTSERTLRRVEAERAWLRFGREIGCRVEIFRLAGIYGPGRSVIEALRAGTARRIVKAGQVFNRIHVEDIAQVLLAAMDRATGHSIYNVSDDEPAAPADVVAYAAELLGVAVPPEVPFDAAQLTSAAASFWTDCRRVSNARIKRELGVRLVYPTYREGLRALATA